jgi:hypothetical protein
MSTSGFDVGAVIQGGVGIGEIVGGMIIQDETQGKIKDWQKKYPEMDIPTAIVQATDLYRQDAQRTRLPGQDLYESQIQQNTAQGISASREAATSAADLLGATTSLYGQQSQAMTNLEIEAARQQSANRTRYGQQLNTLGQWQQQQYYMNEYYPWVSQMNRLEGIQQSSYDMIVGGINTLSASGANMSSGSGGSPQTSSQGMTNTQNTGSINTYLGVQQAPWESGQGIGGDYSTSYGTEIDLGNNAGYNWNM